MGSGIAATGWPIRLVIGLVAGGAVVYVDNVAFAGEASPVVIVALLLVLTATAGTLWGRRGVLTSLVAWVCVPSAHVVKHVLGWPDTLHPNNSASIGYLAAFTLVITVIGTVIGMVIHGVTRR